MQLLSSIASKCVSKACGNVMINMVGGYRPTDHVYDEECIPQVLFAMFLVQLVLD